MGYVSANYLTYDEVQTEMQYVVCRALNVRKGPGTKNARVGILYRGDAVQVLSVDGGWARIAYDGGIAYVSASYLAK